MAVVLGLLTAVFFGSGDFFGGLATKRTAVLNVVGISHLVGLIGVSALIPFFDSEFSASALGFGVLAGGFSGAGVMLLYRGLARGPMAVIAPLTAITSAAVPTIWGVASGDSVSGVAWIGIAVALVAIGMVSIPNEMGAAPITGQAIGEALVSGACFGAMFIAFLSLTASFPPPRSALEFWLEGSAVPESCCCTGDSPADPWPSSRR